MKIRIEKRITPSVSSSILATSASLVLALIVCGFLLLLFGVSPLKTYVAMVTSAFGSVYSISEVLVKAIPLMLCGLGISVAFKRKFWNIGTEGQLAVGGITATGIALFLPKYWQNIPGWTHLLLAAIAGFVSGGLWGLLPAVLQKCFTVNEILTTLMFNYVAIQMVEYLFYGPWKDPKGYGFPGTAEFPPSALLPRLSGRVHLGLVFAIVAAVLLWFVLKRTTWGFEIKTIGANPHAAKYAGMNLAINLLQVAFLSGGLAGLAGMAEVCGIAHRLTKGLTVGYGFTAITVSWLAQLHPLGVLVAAFFIAGLLVGGDQIQISMGLPASVAVILQGTILFFILAGEILQSHKITFVKGGRRG